MERWPEAARRRWLGLAGHLPSVPAQLSCALGWMNGPVKVGVCLQDPVSAGRGAGAVPLVLVAMRGSREGHCLLPCLSNPGMLRVAS